MRAAARATAPSRSGAVAQSDAPARQHVDSDVARVESRSSCLSVEPHMHMPNATIEAGQGTPHLLLDGRPPLTVYVYSVGMNRCFPHGQSSNYAWTFPLRQPPVPASAEGGRDVCDEFLLDHHPGGQGARAWGSSISRRSGRWARTRSAGARRRPLGDGDRFSAGLGDRGPGSRVVFSSPDTPCDPHRPSLHVFVVSRLNPRASERAS